MGRIVSRQRPSIASQLLSYRWPGYRPIAEEVTGNLRTITLIPLSSPGKCPSCGCLCYKVHASPWREAFDAPLFPGERLKLRFQVLRYRCSCGRTFTVSPSFIEPRAKVTNAMVLFGYV